MSEQEVNVGQEWEEVDPRMTKPRTITVLAVEGDKVTIKSFFGRITKANIKRFNGKRGGYTFIDEAGTQ